jgi:hypothetical protein
MLTTVIASGAEPALSTGEGRLAMTVANPQRYASEGASIMPDTKPKRWTRNHTIWLLIVLSVAPFLLAAAFREGWEQLPSGVRGATILVSAILIVAVVALILTGGGKRSSDQAPDA